MCGSGKPQKKCCELYTLGGLSAPSPEALMRSRFVAFATTQVEYILATENLAQANDIEDLKQWCDQTQWFQLEVLSASDEGLVGKVHFKAHFMLQGNVHVLEEVSDFKKIAGKWLYVRGKVID